MFSKLMRRSAFSRRSFNSSSRSNSNFVMYSVAFFKITALLTLGLSRISGTTFFKQAKPFFMVFRRFCSAWICAILLLSSSLRGGYTDTGDVSELSVSPPPLGDAATFLRFTTDDSRFLVSFLAVGFPSVTELAGVVAEEEVVDGERGGYIRGGVGLG